MTGRYGENLPAREIAIQELNSMRGRLFNAIEAVGLRDEQERAVILLIKNLSYQSQAVIEELFRNFDPEDASRFTYNNRLKRNE